MDILCKSAVYLESVSSLPLTGLLSGASQSRKDVWPRQTHRCASVDTFLYCSSSTLHCSTYQSWPGASKIWLPARAKGLVTRLVRRSMWQCTCHVHTWNDVFPKGKGKSPGAWAPHTIVRRPSSVRARAVDRQRVPNVTGIETKLVCF